MKQVSRGAVIRSAALAFVLFGPPMGAYALGWPFDTQAVPKDSAIFQIFGDWNSLQIHDGVDFQAPIGTPVKSIEAGVVLAVQPDPNGKDEGIVIIGATQGATEGWKYGHVDFPPAVLAALMHSRDTGTVLPAGTQVGTVTDFLGVGPDHLHLERSPLMPFPPTDQAGSAGLRPAS